MKLTKDRFTCWECIDDDDYENKYDDELIINVNEGETNRDIADYILECQEKAEKWDLVDNTKKISQLFKEIEMLKQENKQLKDKLVRDES